MGIHDRPYMHEQQPQRPGQRFTAASMRGWRITTWLILINVAVFVLNTFTQQTVEEAGQQFRTPGLLFMWGYFSFDTAVAGGQVWRWISFQFLHDPFGIGHILFNMIGIWVFGSIAEMGLGRARFVAFYLLCGVAGPVAYMLLMFVGFLDLQPHVPMVGASAGLFGILVAAAVLAPNRQLLLLFPPIPVKIWVLAVVYVGIAMWVVYTRGHNVGGEAAHLGGAALGLLLIFRPHWLNWAERLAGGRRRLPPPGPPGGGGQMTYRGWR